MKLYRLSTAPYARLLDGEGAAIRGARWNPPKVPMIYTAAETALAVLEVLAHFIELPELPNNTVMVTYELTGRQGLKRPAQSALPEGWDCEGPPYGLASQSYGSKFIASQDVLLRDPSVVVRTQWNYLLNPRTIGGRVKIKSVAPFMFDHRFIGLLGRS